MGECELHRICVDGGYVCDSDSDSDGDRDGGPRGKYLDALTTGEDMQTVFTRARDMMITPRLSQKPSENRNFRVVEAVRSKRKTFQPPWLSAELVVYKYQNVLISSAQFWCCIPRTEVSGFGASVCLGWAAGRPFVGRWIRPSRVAGTPHEKGMLDCPREVCRAVCSAVDLPSGMLETLAILVWRGDVGRAAALLRCDGMSLSTGPFTALVV